MKKITVLLVHGTWAGAARWTHPGSLFRQRLEKGLERLGYESDFRLFPWNGKNRWRARVEVAEAVNQHLDKVLGERGTELLVVAHSHGGNIAADAVRARLHADSDLPLRGVVCLNTPFLTHQLRGSSGFLPVWLLVTLALVAGLWGVGDGNAELTLAGQLQLIAEQVNISIDRRILQIGLVSVFSVAGCLFLISKYIQRKEHRLPWEPRPRILCLSCPDDEAITFLGLGEGIANLPQLLLHPLSMALFWISALGLVFLDGRVWCGKDLACWSGQVGTMSVVFIVWLGVALIGGAIGTLLMALMFGLSTLQTLKTLVSRVLVSYVPLRPSKSHFRGISDLQMKWSPIQLFHSGIYDSPQTVEEICTWLKQYPK